MNKYLGCNERTKFKLAWPLFVPLGRSLSVYLRKALATTKAPFTARLLTTVEGSGQNAKFVQQRASRRAAPSRNGNAVAQTPWHCVDHFLLSGQSPESISDKLDISHELIYRLSYHEKKADGCWQGCLRCQKPNKKR